MPKSTDLPVAMRPLTSYNGVNWVHEYQTACMDKITRFIKTQSVGGKSEINAIEFTKKENDCMKEIERTDPEGMANEAYLNEV